jgi:hypothetical protein
VNTELGFVPLDFDYDPALFEDAFSMDDSAYFALTFSNDSLPYLPSSAFILREGHD